MPPAWWRGLAPASPCPKPPKPAIAATRRRALDAQRLGARARGTAEHGRRRVAPGLPAGRSGERAPGLAPGGGPAPAALAEARGPHGRERARRAGLHGLPGPAAP